MDELPQMGEPGEYYKLGRIDGLKEVLEHVKSLPKGLDDPLLQVCDFLVHRIAELSHK